MGDDRCLGCGSEMAPDARYCLKCGRTRTAPVLDLQPVPSISAPPTVGAERAVAEHGGGSSPRRGSLLALGALLVAIVAVVVVLSGGDGGSGGSASPSTTSTEPPRTTQPRVPRPTTTLPPVVTSQIGVPGTPVLGEVTGGLSLYAISGSNVARVDLDTGAVKVVRRAFRRAGAYTSGVLVLGDRLVVARDQAVYVMPRDLSSDPEQLDGISLDVSVLSGRILGTGYDEGDPLAVVSVQEFDGQGGVVNTWSLPPQTWPSGVVGDRLVVQTAGRVYLLGTDGTVTEFGVGEVITVTGRTIVWRHCDAQLRCAVSADDVDSGASIPLPHANGSWYYGRWGPLVAPDLRSAVISDADGARAIDLVTGSPIAAIDGESQPTWTPDGAWLFTYSSGRGLVAVSTRDGTQLPLPFGADLGGGTADFVFVVG